MGGGKTCTIGMYVKREVCRPMVVENEREREIFWWCVLQLVLPSLPPSFSRLLLSMTG
jgi:hypothetical protein